jgi:O-antigen ligase
MWETPAAPPLGFPTIAMAAVITSYFYCLPLGRFALGGITSDFRIYDFICFGFLFLMGAPIASRALRICRRRSSFCRWALLLAVLVWVSLMLAFAMGTSDKIMPSLIRAYRFTCYLLMPAFVIVIADTPRRWRFLLMVFFVNVCIQAGLAFLQGVNIVPYLWPSYWRKNYGEATVGTLSPHHKHIGVVMLLGVALALSLLRSARSLVIRAAMVGTIAVMLMVIVFCGARTAWLGIGVSGLAYMIIHRGRALLMLPMLALGVAAIFWVGQDLIRKPLEDQVRARLIDRIDRFGIDGVARDRTRIYEDFPTAVAENPHIVFIGAGFQNISSVMHATGAHNNYAQVWFELGIVGMVVYLRLLSCVLKNLRATGRRAPLALQRIVARDVWAVFWGILATMLVGETLWAQYSMFTLTGQIMALVGLAVAPFYQIAPPSEEVSPDDRMLRAYPR